MKKIIALALSLMLLLGCVSALADETAEKDTLTMLGAFSIKYDKLPEGFSFSVLKNTEMEYEAIISSTDNAKPIYLLTMAFSDQWDGVNTLADVTDEELAAVKADFYRVTELDLGDIEFSDGQTGLGTPLLFAKANDGSFGAVYTIYQSHEIEVDFFHSEEGVGVTEEDFDTIVKFLTDVEFVPAE